MRQDLEEDLAAPRGHGVLAAGGAGGEREAHEVAEAVARGDELPDAGLEGELVDRAEHERTALLVPPQDAAALASAIERLAGNEGLRRELGEAARKHCVEGYSYERMLERMEAVYRNVSGVY